MTYTLIATATLNRVDSQAWLADMLRRIADIPAARLCKFLSWHRQLSPKGARGSGSAFADSRWSGIIALDQQAETTLEARRLA